VDTHVNVNREPDDRAAAIERAASPVHDAPARTDEPTQGTALCLSGGGFRAMLFHAGALKRLNELGYLRRLDRVSSVSGGSIAAGVLAHSWRRLDFDDGGVASNFDDVVVAPLYELAKRRIDIPAIVLGALLPGSIGSWLARAYRRHVFGNATLQDLPQHPLFVFNATSLQSGVLRRFAQPFAWDYRVGKIDDPTIELAVAAAASSAFPPFLSPLVLKLPPGAHVPGTGTDLEFPPYTTRLVLTDGGVYDNLGLETAWRGHRTILISDGGGRMGPRPRPPGFWPLQLYRVLSVIDNQVRSLRKRQAIDAFKADVRNGTYWGIRTDIGDYHLPTALPCPFDSTLLLAETKTRLTRLPELRRRRLINWGYAVCDAAMRTHVEPSLAAPAGFPYPEAGIG
jgi:NTE family protein